MTTTKFLDITSINWGSIGPMVCDARNCITPAVVMANVTYSSGWVESDALCSAHAHALSDEVFGPEAAVI